MKIKDEIIFEIIFSNFQLELKMGKKHNLIKDFPNENPSKLCL